MRLLQNFSAISLASDAQPLDSRPPADWADDKEGRKGREKIRPRAHLSMYVQVCVLLIFFFSSFLPNCGLSWIVLIFLLCRVGFGLQCRRRSTVKMKFDFPMSCYTRG